MTEAQYKLYPQFETLPVYDESDDRCHTFTLGDGNGIRECVSVAEVEAHLANPAFTPLGAIRVAHDGSAAVVVFFGELPRSG